MATVQNAVKPISQTRCKPEQQQRTKTKLKERKDYDYAKQS